MLDYDVMVKIWTKERPRIVYGRMKAANHMFPPQRCVGYTCERGLAGLGAQKE